MTPLDDTGPTGHRPDQPDIVTNVDRIMAQ